MYRKKKGVGVQSTSIFLVQTQIDNFFFPLVYVYWPQHFPHFLFGPVWPLGYLLILEIISIFISVRYIILMNMLLNYNVFKNPNLIMTLFTLYTYIIYIHTYIHNHSHRELPKTFSSLRPKTVAYKLQHVHFIFNQYQSI